LIGYVTGSAALINLFADLISLHRYRQYGLWERYAELYPDGDPVFTVGQSDHSKDWFFAHVTRYTDAPELCLIRLCLPLRFCMLQSSILICRKVGNGYVPTTRQIRFNLDRVVADGTYTLRIALAAAQMSRLQVQILAAD